MSKETISPDTKEMLREFAAAIVSEIRKPEPPTPQQEQAMKQAQAERMATAESVRLQAENKRAIQLNCSHSHARREGGGTHCVWVKDNDVPQSVGYVYCQRCEGRFRPDEPLMRKLDPTAIFDNVTFNRLMQECIQTGAEIMS